MKKRTRKQIEKELDKRFSYYIRLYYADNNGIVKCYTCESDFFWKDIQNGHFKTRGRHKTRRCFLNCKPQCVGCNVFKHGAYQQYTLKMIEEHGKQWVEDRLNDKSIHKRQTYELEDMIIKYKELVQQLMTEKQQQ